MLAQKRSLLWIVGLLCLVLSGVLGRFAGHVEGVDLLSSVLLGASVVASGIASFAGGESGGSR